MATQLHTMVKNTQPKVGVFFTVVVEFRPMFMLQLIQLINYRKQTASSSGNWLVMLLIFIS